MTDMPLELLEDEVARGARLVTFHYTISICVLTFTESSRVYLVRPGEWTLFKSLPSNLITLLLGWWAFPFGPFLSLGALFLNLRGGEDVTERVLEANRPDPRIGWDTA